jgi:hypothetical protein
MDQIRHLDHPVRDPKHFKLQFLASTRNSSRDANDYGTAFCGFGQFTWW